MKFRMLAVRIVGGLTDETNKERLLSVSFHVWVLVVLIYMTLGLVWHFSRPCVGKLVSLGVMLSSLVALAIGYGYSMYLSRNLKSCLSKADYLLTIIRSLPDLVVISNDRCQIVNVFGDEHDKSIVGKFVYDVFGLDELSVCAIKDRVAAGGVHNFKYATSDSVYEVRVTMFANDKILLVARDVTSLAALSQAVAISSMSSDELLYYARRGGNDDDEPTVIISNRAT